MAGIARNAQRRSIFALLLGVCTFAAMHWFMFGGLSQVLHWSGSDTAFRAWFKSSSKDMLFRFWTVYSYAMVLVPGILAGVVAPRAGLLHGAIVGASMPIVVWVKYQLALYSHAMDMGPWINPGHAFVFMFDVVKSAVLCAVGGVVGDWLVRRRVNSNCAIEGDAAQARRP